MNVILVTAGEEPRADDEIVVHIAKCRLTACHKWFTQSYPQQTFCSNQHRHTFHNNNKKTNKCS